MGHRIIIIAVLLLSFSMRSQQPYPSRDRAEKKFDDYHFIKAGVLYEKRILEGEAIPEDYMKLADSYYFRAEFITAMHWYEDLFGLGTELPAEYYYRYAQTLKSAGDYIRSDSLMLRFQQEVDIDRRSYNFHKESDYLRGILHQSGRYEVCNLAINSRFSDFAPVISGENLLFASARDTGVYRGVVDHWNDEPFLDIYTISNSLIDVSHHRYTKLPGGVNTELHESTMAVSTDGKQLYFTRNNFLKGKQVTDSLGYTKLRILRSHLDPKGNWTRPEDLSINDDGFSNAHPSLSEDGKYLFFASDRPGGYGESDIWYVSVQENGSFGEPVNLGPGINTEGKDTFPFIAPDNTLYFATDGRPGLGGLDVFAVGLDENMIPDQKIFNLGVPVNSTGDDFCYSIDENNVSGYFASNREGGKGSDDIYSFIQKSPLDTTCLQTFVLNVAAIGDSSTVQPLVHMRFPDDQSIMLPFYAENGIYKFDTECDRTYFVKVALEGYETVEKLVVGQDSLSIVMNKEVIRVQAGEDLAEALSLAPIFFENDSYSINEKSAEILDGIAVVMEAYPDLKIQIGSHTDSKGSSRYNLILSEKRATATMNYLLSKGIAVNRLEAKGYGESKLLNDCADDQPCSEMENAENRRSEFLIID
ncbi:OmpA family protein [Robertkochia solimangrovi]|uniref:OmpA family protein n=1 Tax=Robertkochia solimangrovi TaxID=2213046 RepID=UPI00117C7D79|nr:OmpA family protein [Robertkochia solimangrovi]TRZ44462.1 flagellar motor protein MotB [Robertkochia solimangrovi]